MKICPTCNRTYQDPTLNFCLEDGSVLQQAQASATPDTVLINQPRTMADTAPTTPQMQQPQWNTAPQQYAGQPKRSSKAWIWVLLILGGLMLMCGGGVVGLIFFAASQESQTGPLSKDKTPTPSGPDTAQSDRTNVERLDLAKWVPENPIGSKVEYSGGELVLAASKKGFYYVLAGTPEQRSVNADVAVTVRNKDDKDTDLGFGLVFHSNPSPLKQGYAFLIDSRKKRYRVVHHSPGKEEAVVNWTNSDLILGGDKDNRLEVRDRSDKIELYINGKMISSIKNVYGYPNGVVGLYSGDGIEIAFKGLEIRR